MRQRSAHLRKERERESRHRDLAHFHAWLQLRCAIARQHNGRQAPCPSVFWLPQDEQCGSLIGSSLFDHSIEYTGHGFGLSAPKLCVCVHAFSKEGKGADLQLKLVVNERGKRKQTGVRAISRNR